MTEVEELKARIKEYERKIYMLTVKEKNNERAKYFYNDKRGINGQCFTVSIKIPYYRLTSTQEYKTTGLMHKLETKYIVVCRGKTKEELINELDKTIEALQDIRQQLTEDGENNDTI